MVNLVTPRSIVLETISPRTRFAGIAGRDVARSDLDVRVAHDRKNDHIMILFFDWFPPAVVGATFTAIGVLKVYGLRKGIVGGGGKSAACGLLGRCPAWSKTLHTVLVLFFLGAGLVNLAILLTLRWKSR